MFLDGPRTSEDRDAAKIIRDHVSELTAFRSIQLIEQEENRGLAASIIGGVSAILESSGRVIVLEDDLVTSPVFLEFMNDALNMYADDEEVASIHGYIYQLSGKLPETFFLRGADCWGWATWKRAWTTFNQNGAELLEQLEKGSLVHAFDLDGTSENTRMLRDQIAGTNDSWAIRWHASAFLKGMLTLYPGQPLVQNIGNDASGTHCGTSDVYDNPLKFTPVNLNRIPLQEDFTSREQIKSFFRERVSSRKKPAPTLLNRVRRFLGTPTR